MPEPRPLGEMSLRAIVRAICCADPVKVRGGGCVESVVTRLTQRLVERFFAMGIQPVSVPVRIIHRRTLARAGIIGLFHSLCHRPFSLQQTVFRHKLLAFVGSADCRTYA
jgi:hypothetical protein